MENVETPKTFEVKKYLYYFLIGIVSLVMMIALPMIGSTQDIGFALPTSSAGWLVFLVTRLGSAIMNILIFHCFMEQGKLNIAGNEYYIKANQILGKLNNKVSIPRSPGKYNGQQYGIKAVTLFIGTAVSTVVLTNAILKYDWMMLLVYMITLALGIVFGILQMKNAETYWTDEYHRYALMMKDKWDAEDEENKVDNILGDLRIDNPRPDINKINKGELQKCLQSMAKNLEIWKNKS